MCFKWLKGLFGGDKCCEKDEQAQESASAQNDGGAEQMTGESTEEASQEDKTSQQ